MDRNSPLSAPAGPANQPLNEPPPKYIPQFSAATEMILKRINSGATSSLSSIGITGTPPGYEDMRRSVLEGMKTSMNMELPATSNSAKRGSRAGGSGRVSISSASATPSNAAGGSASGKPKAAAKPRAKAGSKRKRTRGTSDSDDEDQSESEMSKLGDDSGSDLDEVDDNISELPKITQSGRQVIKPTQFIPAVYGIPSKRRAPSRKLQEQALCNGCARGHSPINNMIVFCDGCNLGWHQLCHDPSISPDVLKDESTPWFCASCTVKSSKRDRTSTSSAIPSLKMVPLAVEPIKGVSGQERSPEEKKAYLNSLPHPQLVSLLLQATNLHPNLPIFPPKDINVPHSQGFTAQSHSQRQTNGKNSPMLNSQQPFPPSAAANLFTRVDANPKAPINFIRKITALSPAHSSSATAFQHASSAPPSLPPQRSDGSRDSTPASPPYPKAGTGLMKSLGPDEDDIEWLVDNSDFDSFSHIVYNEAGEKVEENGVLLINATNGENANGGDISGDLAVA